MVDEYHLELLFAVYNVLFLWFRMDENRSYISRKQRIRVSNDTHMQLNVWRSRKNRRMEMSWNRAWGAPRPSFRLVFLTPIALHSHLWRCASRLWWRWIWCNTCYRHTSKENVCEKEAVYLAVKLLFNNVEMRLCAWRAITRRWDCCVEQRVVFA